MVTTSTATRNEDGMAPMRQLSQAETLAEFDAQAQEVLQISGVEFVRRLDAGDLDDIIDDPGTYPGITYLLMLSDVVR